MVYDCLSVSFAAFFRQGAIPRTADINSFAHELNFARAQFRYPFVDVQIRDPEFDLDAALTLVAGIAQAGFVARILTDGLSFSDRAQSVEQIRELTKAGASRVLLHLDEERAARLPEHFLRNYVDACSSCGLGAELRFDFQSDLPDIFFDLIRNLESARFYSKVYPAKLRPVRRSQFDAAALNLINARIAVSSVGEILIRFHREDETTEVPIGNLFGEDPLSQCIRPDWLDKTLGNADEQPPFSRFGADPVRPLQH